MPLIDCHVHAGSHILDAEREVKRGEIAVVINSTSAQDATDVIELKRRLGEGSFAFVGLHPNSNQAEIKDVMTIINAHAKLIDGVGEIGLDERVDEKYLKDNFILQLELAERLAKPVNLHSRGRMAELLEILASYRLNGVLLHWFSGNDAELAKACDRGYFIGFGPASVYSKKIQRLLVKCPFENLMTESDSPVRYSSCFEGIQSDPRLVASVAFSMSILKKVGAAEMERIIENNFKRYMGY